nr:MAG TPA: hypothetical protein [Caudoviricetes sp.]
MLWYMITYLLTIKYFDVVNSYFCCIIDFLVLYLWRLL